MNKTFKFGATRLTVLWLGVSLVATGAAATTLSRSRQLRQPLGERRDDCQGERRSRRLLPGPAPVRPGFVPREPRPPGPPRRWRKPRHPGIAPTPPATWCPTFGPLRPLFTTRLTGKVLYEENSMDERSIASITKVMTAIVFLENATDLNQEVTIERSDTLRASTTYLKTNDRVRVSDLLHLLLIPSDNAAARALARDVAARLRRLHCADELRRRTTWV